MNPRAWLDEIDEHWACWFAGFVDGEGCFSISGSRCSFSIKLRADDTPLLEKIQARLGVGKLYNTARCGDGNDKPQTMYRVENRRDLPLVCDFFDRYRLQSKKARDFGIWARAVDLSALGDDEGIALARNELREIRAYKVLARLTRGTA